MYSYNFLRSQLIKSKGERVVGRGDGKEPGRIVGLEKQKKRLIQAGGKKNSDKKTGQDKTVYSSVQL